MESHRIESFLIYMLPAWRKRSLLATHYEMDGQGFEPW